ncbi:MAG: class I SAM-dependent methyltransferase [Vicinamibacterales bacterium]
MTTKLEAEEARIRDVYGRRGTVRRDSPVEPGQLFMLQERERKVLALLARRDLGRLEHVRILEVGCGTGQWLRDFVKWGATPERICGVDLLPDRIAQARQLCPAGMVLTVGSAAALDHPDGSFDIVLQSTVFTSVLDGAVRKQIADEMRRVTRPGGFILWYDYHVNSPANPDVRGVDRREIERLFPSCRITLERVTLAPPLARGVAPYSHAACELLNLIPLLRTHYLGAIEPERR